jgi:hypothetical protein
MNDLFSKKNIPNDIEILICSFIDKTIDNNYWTNVYKNYFSINVLSKINIKFYYNKYVLSKINKEYKIVGIGLYCLCDICYIIRESEINLEIYSDINCYNCNMLMPCLNCYYYGYDICSNCSNTYEIISWKNISGFFEDGIKYKSFKEYKKIL